MYSHDRNNLVNEATILILGGYGSARHTIARLLRQPWLPFGVGTIGSHTMIKVPMIPILGRANLQSMFSLHSAH